MYRLRDEYEDIWYRGRRYWTSHRVAKELGYETTQAVTSGLDHGPLRWVRRKVVDAKAFRLMPGRGGKRVLILAEDVLRYKRMRAAERRQWRFGRRRAG